MASDIRLIHQAFDPLMALREWRKQLRTSGAQVSFVGTVRAEQGVEALELQHYEPLTLAGFEQLGRDVRARWPLDALLVIHRCGVIEPGAAIVLVAAAACHRRDAFEAADYTMDHLKSASWLWKRERRAQGWRWIEPRSEDHRDLRRWVPPAS